MDARLTQSPTSESAESQPQGSLDRQMYRGTAAGGALIRLVSHGWGQQHDIVAQRKILNSLEHKT